VKRVLLVKSRNLIASGIASLIKQAKDINLLNKSIDDIHHLVKEVRDLNPNILILNKSLGFATSQSILGLLCKFPDIRIFVIDDFQNIIHVYEKREFEVRQSGDLVGLIRNED
jgi:DNA-binding NarL/FixJ family response regulator